MNLLSKIEALSNLHTAFFGHPLVLVVQFERLTEQFISFKFIPNG
jgi:hypothetical protein